MINVADKHIVVAGAARSGLAAAILLKEKGASVFVTDHGSISSRVKSKLNKHDIPFEEGGHTTKAEQGNFLVLSPGVPTESPLPQKYRQDGKKLYSEIEMASWFNESPIIAVTGSNGKTTVTNWLDHTWQLAGRSHITSGNIGRAFSDDVTDTSPNKEALLEISSFQLDHIHGFHPHISLLLNITPDHLDRYQNYFSKYAAAKYRITENQQPNDCFIYNYDDSQTAEHAKSLKKKTVRSSWRFQSAKSPRNKPAHLFGIRKLS